MDILIKNLKMPIGERKVVLILKSDGEVSVYEDNHGLVRFTDAIELPPHGRLIDLDELEKKKIVLYDRNEEVSEEFIDAYDILNAPVIVEANNE